MIELTKEEVILIEVNFYGGGGSKLTSTAGEYRDLYNVLEGKYKFIWVTDGLGWKTTARPLRETFNHNDYLLSLSMLEKRYLRKYYELMLFSQKIPCSSKIIDC